MRPISGFKVPLLFFGVFYLYPLLFVVYSIYTRICIIVTYPFVQIRDNRKSYLLSYLVDVISRTSMLTDLISTYPYQRFVPNRLGKKNQRRGKRLNSGVKFLVQWQDSYFVVCPYLNGRIKQCTVTFKDLETSEFTHCRLFSWLYGKCFPKKLSTTLVLESIRIFNIVANEEPTWLFHSDTLSRLHLLPLSAPVLAIAVKSCS